MKRLPISLLCLGFLAGFTASLNAAKDKGLDVLISAYAIPSPEGFRPKPGQPMHYVYSQSKATLGDTIAGVKFPEPPAVERAIVAELAKQGFVRTEVGGPLPDLIILATVGDANFEQPRLSPFDNPMTEAEFEPYIRRVNARPILGRYNLGSLSVDALFDPARPVDGDIEQARDEILAEAIRIRERGTARGRDKSKIMGLIGAPKVEEAVAAGALSRSAGERLAWAAAENRYYVTLTAFDAESWKAKQQVRLWRTTMLIDWREDFSRSLEEMLAQAGPLFGTDVAVPGFVNTAKARQANVEIGDAKVVPEKGSPSSTGTKK